MTDQQIIDAFKTVREVGIATWSFNMIGIPTETVEDFKKTIKLNELCEADYTRASLFTEYPGMQLPIDSCENKICSPSYIRPIDTLNDKIRRYAQIWLDKLNSENRLWFTDSELSQLSF